MIYIASPYSSNDEVLRNTRYEQAIDYGVYLMSQRINAFSPIAYGHQFSLKHSVPIDHEWWLSFNEHMLINSTAMHVLTLHGWKESLGIHHEIKFASRHQIPIKYIRQFGPVYEEVPHESL